MTRNDIWDLVLSCIEIFTKHSKIKHQPGVLTSIRIDPRQVQVFRSLQRKVLSFLFYKVRSTREANMQVTTYQILQCITFHLIICLETITRQVMEKADCLSLSYATMSCSSKSGMTTSSRMQGLYCSGTLAPACKHNSTIIGVWP
jgi:hypothetical protein